MARLGSAEARGVLATTVLASGVGFLATTAVNIALPTLQRELDATLSEVQWVLDAYLLFLSALMLASGYFGDRWGRKRVYQAGITLFSAASLASGLAPSVGVLIAFQAVAGIGAALMIPGSLAILRAAIDPDQQGRAVGLWAGLAGALGSLGPVVGGWLAQTLGWRSVFFFVVPFGAGALFLSLRFVPESRGRRRPIDWRGTSALLLAFLALTAGLVQAPAFGWLHAFTLCALGGGAALLFLFVRLERRCRHPLLPLELFSIRRVAGANAATLLLYFALSGLFFLLTFHLQQLQERTPAEAGLGLAPPSLLIAALSGPSGSFTDRHGPRLQAVAGPLAVAAATAHLAFAERGDAYWTSILPGLVLFGAGMAFVIPAITTAALGVESEHAGVASGVNNTAARAAGLLAIALLGSVLAASFRAGLEERLAGVSTPVAEAVLARSDALLELEVPERASAEEAETIRAALPGAFTDGYRAAIAIAAGAALLASAVAAATVRGVPSGEG